MTETLYVSKEDLTTYSTDTVIKVFKSSDSLDEIRKYVENAEERLYVSWASVDGVDKDSQKIPIELVIKSQEELMKRDAPIMVKHTNKKVGKTLAYKVMQHPQKQALGVLHLNLIHKGLLSDDDAWSKIQKGEYKGSSVGGVGRIGSKEFDEDTKSMVEVFTEFGQYETSIVHSPANPLALNEAHSVVAKSEKMEENKEINPEIISEDVLKSIKEELVSLRQEFNDVRNVLVKKEEEEQSTSEEVAPVEEDTQKEEVQELRKMISELAGTVKSLVDAKQSVKEVVKEEIIETPSPEIVSHTENLEVKKEASELFKELQSGKISPQQLLEKLRSN